MVGVADQARDEVGSVGGRQHCVSDRPAVKRKSVAHFGAVVEVTGAGPYLGSAASVWSTVAVDRGPLSRSRSALPDS